MVARDGGSPAHSATLNVDVIISDTNDHAPTFEKEAYSITLDETHPLNERFLTVRAHDPDQGLNGQVRACDVIVKGRTVADRWCRWSLLTRLKQLRANQSINYYVYLPLIPEHYAHVTLSAFRANTE